MATASKIKNSLTRKIKRTLQAAANKVVAPVLRDAALTTFINFAHDYFPEHLFCSDSKFHDWLKERLGTYHLERGQLQAIIAPRGSAKSTWITLIYVLYCALFKIEPYIIIISDTDKQAKLFLKRIKDELEHNERLRAAFPASCRRWEVWQSSAIELANGVRIEAVGKGGKIRGRIHLHYRPTMVILDDPQNLDDAYSEEQLDKDYDWIRSDVLKAGSPQTNVLVLGTALAPKCIVCQLEKAAKWKFNRFPQLMREPVHLGLWAQLKDILLNPQDPERETKARAFYDQRPEMNDGAEVLWPSRFPLYDVMLSRYSLGERVFDQEEQGIPRLPGDAEFPSEYFEHAAFWFDEWPTGNLLELWALDPSKGKDSKQGDYQALGRIAVDRYYQFHVEAWLLKSNVSELCEFVVDCHRNHPGEAIVLETNGFQELLKLPLDQIAQRERLDLPIFAAINTVAKPVRIRRLDAILSKREIRFKRGSPGTALLVDQLRQFRVPLPKGQHDDGPDMLEMGIRIAKKLVNRKAGIHDGP